MSSDTAKSPFGGPIAPVESRRFILMTSDIKWALSTAWRPALYACPQFNYPSSTLLDDALYLPLSPSTSSCFLIPHSQLMTLTGKYRQSEFLPASSSKHLCPQSLPSLLFGCSTCVSLSRTPLQQRFHPISFPSVKHAVISPT